MCGHVWFLLAAEAPSLSPGKCLRAVSSTCGDRLLEVCWGQGKGGAGVLVFLAKSPQCATGAGKTGGARGDPMWVVTGAVTIPAVPAVLSGSFL